MPTALVRLAITGFLLTITLPGCGPSEGRTVIPQLSVPLSVNAIGKGLIRDNDGSGTTFRIACGIDGNGNVLPHCRTTYSFNSLVELYAFPVPGWQFSHWSRCSNSTASSITVVMTRDIACDAHFAVDPTYGFTVSLSQSAITIVQGATGDVTATLVRGANFGGSPITLSLMNPPAGITMTAAPNPVAGDSSALTIQVDAAVQPGQQIQLAIRAEGTNANGDPVEHTAGLALTVPGTDFNLSLLLPSLSLVPGETGTNTLTISRAIGYTADIVLTASGLPQGVSAAFLPNPASGTTSQLTLTSQATAPLGTYSVTVTGTAGALARTASITLTIASSHDFNISVGNAAITAPQNSRLAPAMTVDIARHPFFISNIDFTTTGLPPGVLVTFEPNPATGNSTNLNVTVSPTATVGDYPFTIIGNGGGLIRQIPMTLTIIPGQQVCPGLPAADSYVGPQVQPAVAGTQPLRVDSSNLAAAKKIYLTFDVRAASFPQTFEKVELVLTLNFNSGAARAGTTRLVDVYGITDNNDWVLSALSETSIAWGNAPKNDMTSPENFLDWGGGTSNSSRFLGVFGVEPSDQAGAIYRIDITNYLRWGIGQNAGYSTLAPQDQDGFLTIMLGNRFVYNDVADDYSEFFSRDVPAGCARPHLEVY